MEHVELDGVHVEYELLGDGSSRTWASNGRTSSATPTAGSSPWSSGSVHKVHRHTWCTEPGDLARGRVCRGNRLTGLRPDVVAA